MAINPGTPIPSAMPRISLEGPFNRAGDGEYEDVTVCTVDTVSVPQSTEPTVDNVKCVGMDAEIAVELLESKVGVGVAEDDPD